jgi:hypothetical protein
VDNDPIVLLHARALLTSAAHGMTAYVDADLRDTEKILEEAAGTLDFTKPVAVMLIAVLHFIQDAENPYEIVDRLMDAVPAGSYLAVSHLAKDIYPEEMAAHMRAVNEHAAEREVLRTHAEVARFFDGLDLVEPGAVRISKWRPRSDPEALAPAAFWGGVARKQS